MSRTGGSRSRRFKQPPAASKTVSLQARLDRHNLDRHTIEAAALESVRRVRVFARFAGWIRRLFRRAKPTPTRSGPQMRGPRIRSRRRYVSGRRHPEYRAQQLARARRRAARKSRRRHLQHVRRLR